MGHSIVEKHKSETYPKLTVELRSSSRFRFVLFFVPSVIVVPFLVNLAANYASR
jgi:hypothetical protein